MHEELVSRLMDLFAQASTIQGTCLETLELTYAQAKLVWRLGPGDTPSVKERRDAAASMPRTSQA